MSVPAKIEIIGANRCPVKENDGSTTGTRSRFVRRPYIGRRRPIIDLPMHLGDNGVGHITCAGAFFAVAIGAQIVRDVFTGLDDAGDRTLDRLRRVLLIQVPQEHDAT